MTKLIVQALRMTLIFTVLTGLAYPLLVTGIAQTFFRKQADGSLQIRDGRIVGSTLLAQKFESPRYFWPRPSASDFGAVPSGASNLGPTSQTLQSNVLVRTESFRGAHALNKDASIPADMVFQSGSGLDPHISPESASLQIHRVASARHMSDSALGALVAQFTEPSQFGFLGETRVNVFLLNMALDRL
ncbi:MAG: potassium-transporting ATPase subunit KdpC [bacterium]